MAITKTNFINFTRCPRYLALEKIKKEKVVAKMTYLDYVQELADEHVQEILSRMYEVEDDEEIDLVDKTDETLEAMMKYYKQVEEYAAKVCNKVFKGKTISALDTRNQESFDFNHNGIRYLCYVDVINENESNLNIIEVKATTSNSFYKIGSTVNKVFCPIFIHHNGIDYLKDELSYDIENEMNIDDYYKHRNKLFNRYKEGKYIFDLAVQRMIIEGEFKETNQEHKITKTKYFLAVLNHEYIFDGTYDNSEPVYNQDEQGNEIVRIFDFTKITEEYQKLIVEARDNLENNIFNPDDSPVPLGIYCQYKKQVECKYFQPICGSHIPKYNSVLNYYRGIKFINDSGEKITDKLDLINDGYLNLLDIPERWISNVNHLLQWHVTKSNQAYIDKEKISLMINQLQYPIYHLDFETFPCPFPRFKGEKCYEQSPFEFSLHVEHEPGKCDKEKDNFVYLNKTLNDEREIIAKKLVELINPDQGTMLAQNVSFERSVLKRLAKLYPKYSKQLLKIVESSFDLLYIIQGNNKLYKELGFIDLPETWNYYHKDLNGSYSIKKTLPIFSNLSYDNLLVKNGTQAYITYLKYPLYSPEEYTIYYNALVEYCKQDTWAMVEILNALRKLV